MKSNSTTFQKVGWRCLGLFWISFIAILISTLDIQYGSFSYSELPLVVQYSIIASAILLGLTCVFLTAAFVIAKVSKDTILKNGKEAPAKIIGVYNTRTTVDNSLLMGFELEVNPTNGPIFKTTTEQMLKKLKVHKFEIGNKVLVNYHPATGKAIIISNEVNVLNF